MKAQGTTTVFVKQNCTDYHWRIAKRKKHIITFCSAWFSMLAMALGIPMIANAAPAGGVITQGSGNITEGPSTVVNQNSNRLDINWNSFSTNVGESVRFNQPNSNAVAINRVVGGVPSELRGALEANGRVFILNNQGVTFYGTSQVNVGSLVATTADIISGSNDVVTLSAGNTNGSVINHGNIRVSNGGFAVLAAPYVQNTGVITADLGQIALSSATAMTVDLRGDGLITFALADGEAGKLGVDNTGTLQARSGSIAISTNIASDITSSVVNLDGVIDADSFGDGYNGGSILITSKGNINQNNVAIKANGGTNGDGGTIITFADDTNIFSRDASLTARGGTVSGNGGFIEVSGHHVSVNGHVDASATNGNAGTFLIDPPTITIRNAGAADGSDNTVDIFYEAWIEAQSQSGTNIYFMASGCCVFNQITIEDLADGELTGGAGSLLFFSTGTITFLDTSDTISTTTGDIIIRAGGEMNLGNLQTGGAGVENPGVIDIASFYGNEITTGNLTVTGEDAGYIYINKPNDYTGTYTCNMFCDYSWYNYGNVTINGDITTTITSPENAIASVNIGGRNITINGNINVSAHAGNDIENDAITGETSAIVDIDAEQAITINGDTTIYASAIGNYWDNDLGSLGTEAASATLNLSAYYSIIIDGDTDVSAAIELLSFTYEDMDPDMDSGSATASATINRTSSIDGDIIITGDTTASASVFHTVTHESPYAPALNFGVLYSDANASIINTGAYRVQINGNTTVNTTVDGTEVDNITINGSIFHDAVNDILINGHNTVVATVNNTLSDQAHTFATVDTKIHYDAGRDLIITGNNTLTTTLDGGVTGPVAVADLADDASHIYNELAYIAGRNIRITGNTSGTITADRIDYIETEQDYSLQAGNNALIRGNISLVSDANMYSQDASGIPDRAYSATTSVFSLKNTANATIIGNILIDTAVTALYGGSIYSYSTLTSMGIGDLSIQGNINIHSVANNLNDSWNNNKTAQPWPPGGGGFVDAASTLYLNANNNLTITGNTSMTSDANSETVGGVFDGFANAMTAYVTNSGNNTAITGNISVQANATINSDNQDGGNGGYVNAESVIAITANNDLLICGDTYNYAHAEGDSDGMMVALENIRDLKDLYFTLVNQYPNNRTAGAYTITNSGSDTTISGDHRVIAEHIVNSAPSGNFDTTDGSIFSPSSIGVMEFTAGTLSSGDLTLCCGEASVVAMAYDTAGAVEGWATGNMVLTSEDGNVKIYTDNNLGVRANGAIISGKKSQDVVDIEDNDAHLLLDAAGGKVSFFKEAECTACGHTPTTPPPTGNPQPPEIPQWIPDGSDPQDTPDKIIVSLLDNIPEAEGDDGDGINMFCKVVNFNNGEVPVANICTDSIPKR